MDLLFVYSLLFIGLLKNEIFLDKMIFGDDFPPLLASFIFMILLGALFTTSSSDNFVDVTKEYHDQ